MFGDRHSIGLKSIVFNEAIHAFYGRWFALALYSKILLNLSANIQMSGDYKESAYYTYSALVCL